ncbi:UNVERIFIED_CONTAM: hypothetical protein LK11_27800, partial [Mumia flava]
MTRTSNSLRVRPRGLRVTVAGALAGALAGGALVAAAPATAATVDVGGTSYDVTSAVAGKYHYQAAYSETNDLLWVTSTAHAFVDGVPRAAESELNALDPDTLEVRRTIEARELGAGTASERVEGMYRSL